jgi:hypothetical protein
MITRRMERVIRRQDSEASMNRESASASANFWARHALGAIRHCRLGAHLLKHLYV